MSLVLFEDSIKYDLWVKIALGFLFLFNILYQEDFMNLQRFLCIFRYSIKKESI